MSTGQKHKGIEGGDGVSFMDHEVLEGAILPGETSQSSKMDMIVSVPKKSAARETPLELAQEKKSPKFPRWEKVLHPSQPVAVVGKPPCPSKSLEQTYPLEAAPDQSTKMMPTKTPSPAQELEVAHQWMPTPGFMDITACLRSQLPEEVLEHTPSPSHGWG